MNKIILILSVAIATIANAQKKLPFTLEKDWELTGLENPESVVLDQANNVLYVSNVNGAPTDKDGNGYISKISLEGKILEQKWATGFNAPKGLTIHEGMLYVTDIDEVVSINISTKKQTTYPAEGATFLNDIVADKKGNIYMSNTFGFSGIYKLDAKSKKVTLWVKGKNLNMPNGLFIAYDKLVAAGWGANFDPATFATKIPGYLIQINLKDKSVEKISAPFGNLDGLSQTLHGYLISDWFAGKLFYYSNENKTTTKVLDLPKGSADTYFDKKTKSVFIPLMLNNKLLKYHFSK